MRIATILAAALSLSVALGACRTEEKREPYAPTERKKKERAIGAIVATLDNHIVAWNHAKLEPPTPDALTRLHGIEVVIRTEARANLEPLLQQLRIGPPRNRRVVAAALGFAQDPRAIEPLLEAAGDSDLDVANNALVGLGVLSTPRGPFTPAIIPPLLPLLQVLTTEKDGVKRTNAAFAIKRAIESGARSTEALEALEAGLADPEGGVRSQCAAGLGALGDAAAVDPLLAVLGDADPVVRGSAAFALGALRAERARDALEELRLAREPGVREAARAALLALRESGPSSVPTP